MKLINLTIFLFCLLIPYWLDLDQFSRSMAVMQLRLAYFIDLMRLRQQFLLAKSGLYSRWLYQEGYRSRAFFHLLAALTLAIPLFLLNQILAVVFKHRGGLAQENNPI